MTLAPRRPSTRDVRRRTGGSGRAERLSAGDLTVLATDGGVVPMQIAAVLTLPPTERPDRDELVGVLAERLRAVPRLRQRLVRPRTGRGRPRWVDDPDFDLDRHLCVLATAEGHGLLDVAAELVCARLDRRRPLWCACLVDGGPEGAPGLVIVLHHVLADGLGGLAILGALADPPLADPPLTAASARPSPPRAVAAARRRVARLPRAVRRGVAGLRELGLGERPRLAARTSLNRPTGPRRRIVRVAVPLAVVKTAAVEAGGTVNDVVVSTVVGALLDLLHRRGERPGSLVVSVPVSARPRADVGAPGNEVGVRPVRVPAVDDDLRRLHAVVALTRAAADTAQRASSAGPLGLAFRVLAKVGAVGWFVNHQRLVHTFVTNLRGPRQRLRLAGHEITSITPVAVNPGNVSVSFDVLSYAGELGITVVVDPDLVPDLRSLTRSLENGLRRVTRATG
ncbi:wax ester/triacylglycerol synthase domain-containing protein [Ornithinimicrobium avium]|uniref:diacylglycerol O-acyltransferase n=1 Tax=Ornithinimicrobium avium TaxID=2283195 RepID=A0A345NKS7_9MICO|nr:wax ester/triacylglycerol synthase domain-containing protein [Ornithinimicrobium avium]AXH95635.1 DUF1298 domain-containing protein [Ornithinimicrobium avium]